MERRQKQMVFAIMLLVFTTWFLYSVKNDFPLIFQKDLLAHDESSNSVVAANITRKFFPPMVRIHPLGEQQRNWMEGPYWQHIPPLFAYVPYPFFQLDGQITIEVKRLSYAFLLLLTGLIFICSIYRYSKDLWATGAATLATIFWIATPFSHELITGYAFGVSDIVLALTIVCSFGAMLWYMEKEQPERRLYSYKKLIAVGLVVALPIMAKNLLGAIPAATFFILLLRDNFKADKTTRYKNIFGAVSGFAVLLFAYYFPLYLSSPQTFKTEILVSFFHATNYEGWGRPLYWYITNYLPQRYLFGWTWVYYLGLVVSIVFNFQFSIFKDRKQKILLWLPLIWFAWNLIAISLVESKIPNFIYQSYLLSLFTIIYSPALTIPDLIRNPLQKLIPNSLIRGSGSQRALGWAMNITLIILIIVTGYESFGFAHQFKVHRAAAYNYQTEHEKFYQEAEKLRDLGIDQRDLVIVSNPPNDCWERYYILFLTGAESKTLLEMHFNTVSVELIKNKYRDIYFLDKDFNLSALDLNTLDSILKAHKMELEKEVARIKADKTSCQWLVPDPILNAPEEYRIK